MIPMQTIQFLAKQHPRVWRKATILQRKEIANRYVESGNVESSTPLGTSGRIARPRIRPVLRYRRIGKVGRWAMTDYDLGREAFLADNHHLYVNAPEEWKEGYREAWYSHNVELLANDDSGDKQRDAWDEHYRSEIKPFEDGFNAPEPFGVNALNTMLSVSLVLMVGSVGVAFGWFFHYDLMAIVGRVMR